MDGDQQSRETIQIENLRLSEYITYFQHDVIETGNLLPEHKTRAMQALAFLLVAGSFLEEEAHVEGLLQAALDNLGWEAKKREATTEEELATGTLLVILSSQDSGRTAWLIRKQEQKPTSCYSADIKTIRIDGWNYAIVVAQAGFVDVIPGRYYLVVGNYPKQEVVIESNVITRVAM